MGRPKIGNVLYSRRVPPIWVDRLDAFLSSLGAVRDLGYVPVSTVDQKVSKGQEGAVCDRRKEEGDDMRKALLESGLGNNKSISWAELQGKLDEKTKEVKMLLDSQGELETKRKYWEDRFNKAVNATEFEMAAYWKRRALLAEKRAGELENLSS